MASSVRLVSIDSADHVLMPAFQQLVRDFLAELGVSLEFQAVENELAQLPGKYSRQHGGCMLLLIDQPDSSQPPAPIGCVALRDLGDGVGEVKRMFVRPQYRGRGHARALLSAVIDEARVVPRYGRLRLDTLVRLQSANALYKSFGFRPCAAYCYNPIPDALYFEYDLGCGVRQ